MRCLTNSTVVLAIVASLMLTPQFVYAVESGAVEATDQAPQKAPAAESVNRVDPMKKYPIEIPPASEVLSHYKKAIRAKRPPLPKQPQDEMPQLRLLRQLLGRGAYAELSTPQCFRAIPTREEFLRMVRKNPADANQLIERCRLDLRSISPLPQLPVGNRQLPVDTRQRPVGTWNN